MTPVAKYWVCKVAPPVLAEAMECLGGNGYVEELPLARLYREVPVNAIWEGSGNVMALDVLRVQREPAAAEIVLDDIAAARRGDAKLAAGWEVGAGHLHEPRLLDMQARNLVEGLAVLAAGAILKEHAPAAVSEAFIATRGGSLTAVDLWPGSGGADVRARFARASPHG